MFASEAAWHAAEACMTQGRFACEFDVKRKRRDARISLNASISTNPVLAISART